MVKFIVIGTLLVMNLALTAYLYLKVLRLDIEMHYGTYPSDMFPNDPRCNP
jgi:hypothetical protein